MITRTSFGNLSWLLGAGSALVLGMAAGRLITAASAQNPSGEAGDHIATQIGTNRLSITVSGGERVIEANGWPDHTPGQFPRRGNPNRISAQNYNFHLAAHPQTAEKPTPVDHGLFGVALNGVPFDPATAEFWNNDHSSGWNYEANSGFIDLGLDEYNAHVQPSGAYHYHGLPLGLMARKGGDATKMLLVGYAADGFPIYTSRGHDQAKDAKSPLRKLHSSYRLKQGVRPDGPGGKYDGKFTADYEFVQGSGDLDECNGRFGVTPEFPEGTYHYYITDEFPGIPRQWRGTPDPSFKKRGPGPGGRGPGGPGGPGSRPPPGGRPNGTPPQPRASTEGPGLQAKLRFAQTDNFADLAVNLTASLDANS
jgi:hypothetical protein